MSLTSGRAAPAAAAEPTGDAAAAGRGRVARWARWGWLATTVRRTLANVLRNAVQSSPPGGRAEATVSRGHDRLVYTVRDSGPGFGSGQLAQLFDPFYTTRATGTGLGLAVAQRIVQMHGGAIRAENARGGGAPVRISIPGTRG